MTASDTYVHSATGRAGYFDGNRPYALEEREWGYVVFPIGEVSPWAVLSQLAAWAAGVAAGVAAAAIWLVPSAVDAMALARVGLTGALLVTAALLLWFASRGLRPEVEIDLRRREVRQMVRNRAGRPTLVARYGFDRIGGVVLDRSAGRGQYRPSHAALVLRYRNTAQMLPVVYGRASDLMALRDRLGRDLIVDRPFRGTALDELS